MELFLYDAGKWWFSYNNNNIRTFTEIDGHSFPQLGIQDAVFDNENNLWLSMERRFS